MCTKPGINAPKDQFLTIPGERFPSEDLRYRALVGAKGHTKVRSKMIERIKSMGDSRAWHKKYGPLAPKEGDEAPDFELYDVNGENPVRLSDFRGKMPVALVFGSFT